VLAPGVRERKRGNFEKPPVSSMEIGIIRRRGKSSSDPMSDLCRLIWDRVFAGDEANRNGRGGSPRRVHRDDIADDHGDLQAHKFGRETRQPLELIVGVALLDRDVFGEYFALSKGTNTRLILELTEVSKGRIVNCPTRYGDDGSGVFPPLLATLEPRPSRGFLSPDSFSVSRRVSFIDRSRPSVSSPRRSGR